MTKTFPVTRIYSDANGDSHFEEQQILMTDAGTIGSLSATLPVKGIIFREVEPSYDYDFHNAPHRQYIILLEGSIQIETSLGEIRIFNAGDILFVEDITGKGHRTKNLLQQKRKSIFVTV